MRARTLMDRDAAAATAGVSVLGSFGLALLRDPLEDLFAMHRHGLGCFDTEPNLTALHMEYGDRRVVPDAQRLADLPREYEHDGPRKARDYRSMRPAGGGGRMLTREVLHGARLQALDANTRGVNH